MFGDNFDSELYDDLLTVEKKVDELYHNGQITDQDLIIIACVGSQKSFRNLEKIYHISRLKLSQSFKNICKRIAYYLDESFSDECYVEKLKIKYNLTKDEVEKLIKKELN